MPKLTTLKPGLSTLPNALTPPEHRYREQHSPWRQWYRIPRWFKLRQRVFLRDLYTCQWPGCGRIEGNTSLLVAHHIRPHHGNATMFWDEANIHAVCKSCHDGPIKALERNTI